MKQKTGMEGFRTWWLSVTYFDLSFQFDILECYNHTTNYSNMATVFETRLIGNIGKDATVKEMSKGLIAINFPVAHNKNWRDKKTNEQRTKTTWVNCTIWKKEGANMRILDFLTKGTLVEVIGTPFAKGYMQEDHRVKAEIRLNVSKTNILKPAKTGEDYSDDDYNLDEEEVEYDSQDFN